MIPYARISYDQALLCLTDLVRGVTHQGDMRSYRELSLFGEPTFKLNVVWYKQSASVLYYGY